MLTHKCNEEDSSVRYTRYTVYHCIVNTEVNFILQYLFNCVFLLPITVNPLGNENSRLTEYQFDHLLVVILCHIK